MPGYNLGGKVGSSTKGLVICNSKFGVIGTGK